MVVFSLTQRKRRSANFWGLPHHPFPCWRGRRVLLYFISSLSKGRCCSFSIPYAWVISSNLTSFNITSMPMTFSLPQHSKTPSLFSPGSPDYLSDISAWMTHFCLQLNTGKFKLIFFHSNLPVFKLIISVNDIFSVVDFWLFCQVDPQPWLHFYPLNLNLPHSVCPFLRYNIYNIRFFLSIFWINAWSTF